MEYTAITTIPHWGRVGVRVSPQGLTAVLWGARVKDLAETPPGQPETPELQALRCAASQWLTHLQAYFAGKRRTFPLPIAWETLPRFKRRVLQAVAAIPYGETRTYGQIAAAAGSPGAARAVGGAVAHNPMPIVIPCHRVVGHDGSLHGFSGPGGLTTKARLLQLEGVPLVSRGDRLFVL